MRDRPWTIQLGDTPLVAVALHAGHEIHPAVARHLAISEAERWQEEDPATARWVDLASTYVCVHRSRFEVDLNRARERAIYRVPADAWGLTVWRTVPPEAVIRQSLQLYDQFYAALDDLFTQFQARYDRFVIFDLHTYNYRPEMADWRIQPDIEIGTKKMPDRSRWTPLVDRLIDDLRSYDFGGRRLDVQENVYYGGGYFPEWVYRTFPDSACVITLEIQKFFQNAATGQIDPDLALAVFNLLKFVAAGVIEELKAVP
ncbi:MAG: N-formylglutamate amidohydrolase [Gemmatimonadetes bacterium]|nr:MAG: N-formylglutamate amidohydrolase [Gemmatimonadota bacterium]